MSIYQEIWDADQQENGVPALRKDQSQLKDQSVGYAIVDEQASDNEGRLISEVFIPESKRLTYDLCTRLYDNYNLDPGIRDQITDGERVEEREFITTIIPTKPLQLAKEFIARDRGFEVSDTDLAMLIEQTWFLQGKADSKFASGFEHVFVGEQKPTGDKPDNVAVGLGGYHFWHKYYLDDGGKLGDLEFDDRITYSGTNYDPANTTAQGILVPEIVTINFEWTARDYSNRNNESNQRLKKTPRGGFWVGCSPEGLIALGLIRVHTSVGEMAIINNSTYKLKFYSLSNNRKSIRTLYPIFIRTDFINVDSGTGSGDEEEIEEGTIERPENRQISIVSALVNPPGDEAGRETVTLLNNTTASVDLDNWKIVAPNGWKFTFADVTIGAGDTRRFSMISSEPQFRNKGGKITLLEPDGTVHDLVEYSEEQGSQQGMSIVF